MSNGLGRTIIAVVLCCWSVATAQPPTPEEGRPPSIRELPLRGTYMKTEDGQVVWVPNFTWEKYKKWQDQDLAVGPAAYQINQLGASGTVAGGVVTFTVDLEVVILSENDGANIWLPIPLQLDHTILRSVVPADDANVRFDVEPNSAGYRCWVKRGNKRKYNLRLTVAAKVNSTEEGQMVRLRLPRVLREANVELTVPDSQVDFSATGNQRPLETSFKSTDKSSTVATSFAGGEITLNWSPRGPMTSKQRKLEVSSQIIYQIQDLTNVSAVATLDVLSFGQADRLLVKLPPRMELRTGNDTFELPYELKPLPAEDAPTQDANYAEVRFKRSLPANTKVRLEAVLNADDESPATTRKMQLGGFEVIGAAPQYGDIEVRTQQDWSVDWSYSRTVERIAVEDDSEIAARFHFDRQGFQLLAELSNKPRDVRVEPTVEYYVEADEVLQEANLKYEVRGAPIEQVRLNLSGWELLYLGPTDIVERVETAEGELVVTLKDVAQGRKEFSLNISARLEIAAQATDLKLVAIRAVENQVASATFMLENSGSLSITPDLERTSTLVLQRDSQKAQADQWIFHQLQFSKDAILFASVERPKRVTTVTPQHRIGLTEQEATVQQRWELLITNGQVETIDIQLPPLLQNDAPSFSLVDDQDRISLEPNSADEDGRCQLILPEPIAGNQVLECQFTVERGDNMTSQKWDLPLVRVTGPDVRFNKPNLITVNHDTDVTVVADASKALSDRPTDLDEQTSELTFDPQVGRVTFEELPRVAATQPHLFVTQTWLQSTILPQGRRDRAVFALSGSLANLYIDMPLAVIPGTTQVLIDGRRRGFEMQGQTLVVTPEELDMTTGKHVIELWYDLDLPRGMYQTVAITCPRIRGTSYVEFSSWQLLTPQNTHLAWMPTPLTTNHQWIWKGLMWGYQSALSQAELEARASAISQPTLRQEDTNSYLFEVRGPLPDTEIILVQRYVVVCLASGLVMVGGLFFIALPRLRHPAIGLLLGCAILGCAQVLPEQALLIAQTSAIGLVLVVLSYLLEWYTREDTEPFQVHGHVVTVDEASSGEVLISSGEADSAPPTTTAPTQLRIPATSDSQV